MKIFRALFKKRNRIPKPGDVYRFDEDNPFTEYKVTVIAVKDGWVQYKMAGGRISELPMSNFNYCYKPYQAEPD